MDMKDNGCPLNGTRTCRLLNMQACAQCPLNGQDAETPEEITNAVETFERLLPEGGIAPFFETKQCCFCRPEAGTPGGKSGYAIFSMAHPEPLRRQPGVLVRKRKRRSPVGTLVPIQAAVCKACRRRMLALEYLPTVTTLLFGTAGLVTLAVQSVSDAVSRVAEWLPLLIWAVCLVGGWGLGRGLVALLKKSYARVMYTDFREHPVISEMKRGGWFEIPQDKELKFVFSKTRTGYGLGTAPSTAYRKAEGTEENGNS